MRATGKGAPLELPPYLGDRMVGDAKRRRVGDGRQDLGRDASMKQAGFTVPGVGLACDN